MNKATKAVLIAVLAVSLPAMAQPSPPTVKAIGATFLEAPPGRDKSLAPWGAPASLEKVEVHVVVSFGDRIFADNPIHTSESKVKAMARLADKSSVDLGTVDVSLMRKTSEDKKRTLVSMSISRLPDKPVSVVSFNGSIKVLVAKGTVRKSAAFEPKAGSRIDGGFGKFSVSQVEPNSVTLSGGEELDRVAEVKIVKPDGSSMAGERGAYSRMGNTEGTNVTVSYRFPGPLVAGKMEFMMYDGLETIDVPVKVSVSKPY